MELVYIALGMLFFTAFCVTVIFSWLIVKAPYIEEPEDPIEVEWRIAQIEQETHPASLQSNNGESQNDRS